MLDFTFDLNGQPMSSLRQGAISYPAFSGLGQHANRREHACIASVGAIPPGSYYIFDRQAGSLLGPLRDLFNDHSNWFALYAIDCKIDDETFCNRVRRGHFRLHPKGPLGISQGCITLEKLADFQMLRSRLRATSMSNVPGTELQTYGRVIVR